MVNELDTIQASYMKVVDLLRRKFYYLLNTVQINQGRYIICETDKANFLVVYKREFYLSFGKEFKEEGAKGLGETLNVDDLRIAIQKGVTKIIFTYPNGSVYFIELENFLNNSFRRINKEGKATRSISIHLLERWDQ